MGGLLTVTEARGGVGGAGFLTESVEGAGAAVDEFVTVTITG